MEALFIYITKASALIALFYFAYYALLRKETFFNSNRWFLLSGLIVAAVLPLLVYTKTVWIDARTLSNEDYIGAAPIIGVNESAEINWTLVSLTVYGLGVLALLAKFGFDFYNLNSVLKGKKIKQQADFKFVDINENIAPFSYFEYIVYNSSMYTPSELESIIEHEKVHSDQNHTLDVLISRTFCILFWFNPLIWFYKKAILQNLEFIADKEASQKLSDKKAYQYTLLKITTHESCLAITNHFYQSLIKKRIVMLNKNQSKKRNSWKYYMVVPALVAFVLLFQVETIAKERNETTNEKSGDIKSIDVYQINKKSTDAELKKIEQELKTNHNIEFVTSDIKRNAANELTSLKIAIKNGKEQTQSMQSSTKAIKDFGVVVTTDHDGSKKVGIKTSNEATNTKIAIEDILDVKANQNSKTDKDAKTNHYSFTSNDECVAGDNTKTTTVTTSTNVNNSTNVVVTSDVNGKTRSNVTINTKSQPNVRISSNKLIIVDGVTVNNATTDDLQKLKIETMNVWTGDDAVSKFGDDGKNGVIVIETKK